MPPRRKLPFMRPRYTQYDIERSQLTDKAVKEMEATLKCQTQRCRCVRCVKARKEQGLQGQQAQEGPCTCDATCDANTDCYFMCSCCEKLKNTLHARADTIREHADEMEEDASTSAEEASTRKGTDRRQHMYSIDLQTNTLTLSSCLRMCGVCITVPQGLARACESRLRRAAEEEAARASSASGSASSRRKCCTCCITVCCLVHAYCCCCCCCCPQESLLLLLLL